VKDTSTHKVKMSAVGFEKKRAAMALDHVLFCRRSTSWIENCYPAFLLRM
jgi:hypothetical protein